ncbi:MAG: ArnT family glycosyltransferase [Chthoniobacterales bacterium]
MTFAAERKRPLPNDSTTRSEQTCTRAALAVIALGTFLHLLYSTHLELVGDEAYYWLWSRHPDICYLDKGPMIAWLIWVGTALFGQNVFGVRFFAILLASGTGLAVFSLARRLFSARAGFWAVVIASVMPLFAVGASLMTIDTVYVFFWAWAALVFWSAKDQTRLGPWFATGAVVGLGLLSKYTAVIELLSFAAFCLWHRPSRAHFRRATFWVMLGTALLFLVPAIIWNIRHHWPTSDWLLQRGALDKKVSFHPVYVLSFLGEQAGLVSPLLFIGLLFALFRRERGSASSPAALYAAALFLPLFGLYLLLSLHYQGPPNWTAAAYIGGIILLAGKWVELARNHRAANWLAVAALLLATLETSVLLETRWLHLSHRLDPLDRARGSRDLAATVAAAEQSSGAHFVIADNYMTAALLSFYLPGQPAVFTPKVIRPLNQLEIWNDYDQRYREDSALIVAKRENLSHALRQGFASFQPLGSVEAVDGERAIGKYYLYLALTDRSSPQNHPGLQNSKTPEPHTSP